MAELKVARKNLTDALGDKISQYWTVVKSWYRQKLTKEEFDVEARKLLPSEQIKYHNEFVVSLLTKCHVLSMNSEPGESKAYPVQLTMPGKVPKKSKAQKKKKVVTRPTFERRYVPADPMLYIPVDLCVPGSGGALEFCTQSACLPDLTVLHGRILVTAWEWNLETASEKVVPLITNVVEIVLKNVISTALSRKSGYQVKDRHFKHALGQYTQSPNLRSRVNQNISNTHDQDASSETISTPKVVHPTYEESEQEAILQLATAGQPPPDRPLTLDDLLESLQVHQWVLKSHTVSSSTVERIMCDRWHPDHDELKQDIVWRDQILSSDSI